MLDVAAPNLGLPDRPRRYRMLTGGIWVEAEGHAIETGLAGVEEHTEIRSIHIQLSGRLPFVAA